jgi:hypothetical protein
MTRKIESVEHRGIRITVARDRNCWVAEYRVNGVGYHHATPCAGLTIEKYITDQLIPAADQALASFR